MYVGVCARAHVCVCVCVHVRICTGVRGCRCACQRARVSMWVCVHARACVRACVSYLHALLTLIRKPTQHRLSGSV